MNANAIRIATALALAGLMLTSCNSHPVTVSAVAGVVERQERTTIEGTQAMDILWVIDNSGSMCQEQKILRENFQQFIDEIRETNLDFHIGVTTTDMNPTYPLEPVASPGILQSKPQPVPGFDQSCQLRVNDQGQLVEGDYQPIRDAISQAVECMAAPNQSAFNWSDAEIECALTGRPMGCEIASAGCGGANQACAAEDLFPDPGSYRSISKVLRSADYRDQTGALDVARLQADFACMSLVGTRGFGVETGLIAAAEAVSPENTGGSVETPENDSAPNHGLVRRDARFALIFVTDENDCSHAGSRVSERSTTVYRDPARPELNTMTDCGGDICEVANAEGEVNSPLIPIEQLKQQFLENLAETKGRELGTDFQENEVLVASIHGNSQRYAGDVNLDQCEAGGDFSGLVSPTCATALGVAFSGDRYERFLRSFPEGNFYPNPNEQNPDAALTGWMCTGDFGPALQAIGEFLITDSGGCVTAPILPCAGPMDTSCPPKPYGQGAGECLLLPNSDAVMGAEPEYYCDSGIQLRTEVTNPTGDVAEQLISTGYCIEDSIGDRTFPNGCVIARDRYSWLPCPSGAAGLKLEWVDGTVQATNALAGTSLQIRYNSVSSQAPQQPQ